MHKKNHGRFPVCLSVSKLLDILITYSPLHYPKKNQEMLLLKATCAAEKWRGGGIRINIIRSPIKLALEILMKWLCGTTVNL